LVQIIANCETENPPEGWESEGQLRIANLKTRSQPFDRLRAGRQETGEKKENICFELLATGYWLLSFFPMLYASYRLLLTAYRLPLS
jgi:hypothetical protein